MRKIVLLLLILPALSLMADPNWPEIYNKVNCQYSPVVEKFTKKYPFYVKDEKTGKTKKYFINVALAKAIIAQESQGNPKATSPVGAKGLMQIMDKTAKLLGADYGRLYEPDYNIQYGIMFMGALLKFTQGDIVKAISGYNGGSYTTANKSVKGDFAGRIYDHPETKDYVRKVLAHYKWFKENKACSQYVPVSKNYLTDKGIIESYKTVNPQDAAEAGSLATAATSQIVVPEALDTQGKRNFSYELTNDMEHLNFAVPIRAASALHIKFPKEISVTDMTNGGPEIIDAIAAGNIIKVTVKGADKLGFQSNLIVDLSCGISIEFIFNVVSDTATTAIIFTHPEYVEMMTAQLDEKLKKEEEARKLEEEKAAIAAEREQLGKDRQKMEKKELKKYDRYVKAFGGVGIFIPLEHKDADGVNFDASLELLIKIPYDMDLGFIFDFSYGKAAYSGHIDALPVEVEYKFAPLVIAPEWRYNIQTDTIFTPHIVVAPGLAIDVFSGRKYYNKGVALDVGNASETKLAFGAIAGVGFDLEVWDAVMLKVDALYSGTSRNNHTFLINLGVGYSFKFNSKKKEKKEDEDEEETAPEPEKIMPAVVPAETPLPATPPAEQKGS